MKCFVLLAAAGVLHAQAPRVGLIEIFGAHKTAPDKIRKALGVNEGDAIPGSKGDIEERIENMPGIVRANVEAVCCDKGKAILYVGVQEKGAAHFEARLAPSLDLKVPEEVRTEWMEFLTALSIAARSGELAEDFSRGHSFARDDSVRKSQLRFIDFAETHYALLRQVLRDSIEEQQRAIAAYVLGYSSKKKQVADDLQYAMQDPDPAVRANAMRALGPISVLAEKDPEQRIRVTPTWFVEMLNSVHFSDRAKAAQSLVTWTEKRDPRVIEHIRERSLDALVEMARWRALGHALPAFLLLGRIAGLAEDDIHDRWSKGRIEEVIKLVKEPAKRK